ncbi:MULTISPECIES: NAD(P)H-hydrate dehydratase [Vitreoscilla]|uniref:ADP-dependent (S)-NAD(P)H-hydrate dehydratase n=1 Tax=Vitreoscilla stercoraria TaxID=61 RepID=A0ABY4E8X6_VITST|nr:MULTISPECIES: NAD(P)H-hydrate dehydratase [Vitreoscilla]QJQ52158.1 carbohydrate kinase [Vitreoscilla sp. C1]UOO91865.1 NAD(P)H-hydrate dehydratase [Vitreoscilla stercoraria]
MNIPWHIYRSFAQQHFPDVLKPRAKDSHKGTHGTVGIIGGNVGMSGSVIMAAKAALKLGAGKVKIGFVQNSLPMPVLESQPEIMLYTAQQLLQQQDINAWLIGCGMGTDNNACHILQTLSEHQLHKPIVWDADALNLLAKYTKFHTLLNSNHIITPHPTEAARLLQQQTAEIQAQRTLAALNLYQQYHCISVLKGYQTLVQITDTQYYLNESGHAGLATAGSGDVLAGMMVSLLAQGMDCAQAACAAVWLHGVAAEILSLQQIGPIGMVATELIDAARQLRNQLLMTDN